MTNQSELPEQQSEHNWSCSECGQLNERTKTRNQDICSNCGVGLDTITIVLPSRVKVAVLSLMVLAIILAILYKTIYAAAITG